MKNLNGIFEIDNNQYCYTRKNNNGEMERKNRRNANGWKCFYQLVDLFGTKDFESNMMSYAKTLLNAETEFDESLQKNRDYLFPIAVSQTDNDLFVMVLADGREYGQVIWLAGGVIERFDTFSEFFEAMIEYNKEELEDIMGENKIIVLKLFRNLI